jgi:ribosomal 50S subunit-recycling heat shock protein
MRLDLFLKLSRLVPRRTVANKICNAGLVKVNDIVAKPSREIREGDEIEIKLYQKLLRVKVLAIPPNKQVSKSAILYKLLYEIPQESEVLSDYIELI